MKINSTIRMLLRGSLTPHCIDQYSNDDLNTVALQLLKLNYWASYSLNLTPQLCLDREQYLRKEQAKFNGYPSRMKKQIAQWIAYYMRDVTAARKDMKKVNGQWITREEYYKNIKACVTP